MIKKITKPINYKLEIINSVGFLASSLSNIVEDHSEGTHKTKWKYRHDNKKCENFKIKCKYCECYLEYINAKDDLLIFKCLSCNENYKKKWRKLKAIY